jgi:hypothetical protein
LILGVIHGYRIRSHWRDLLKRRKLILAFMSEHVSEISTLIKGDLRLLAEPDTRRVLDGLILLSCVLFRPDCLVLASTCQRAALNCTISQASYEDIDGQLEKTDTFFYFRAIKG